MFQWIFFSKRERLAVLRLSISSVVLVLFFTGFKFNDEKNGLLLQNKILEILIKSIENANQKSDQRSVYLSLFDEEIQNFFKKMNLTKMKLKKKFKTNLTNNRFLNIDKYEKIFSNIDRISILMGKDCNLQKIRSSFLLSKEINSNINYLKY